MNRKPTIVDLILSRSTAAIDKQDSWYGSNKERASFASDRFPHRALRNSTALHYACLVGDMEIVRVLLGHGAKWTISDSIGLLPERYLDISGGDDKRQEFKCLCEEETSKQLKKREQEDELRRAKELEEESKQVKKLEEEESKRPNKLEEESKWLKKLKDEEALLKRRRRQSKCFPFPPLTVLMHFFLSNVAEEIESVIGGKVIGQRGPIRSVASAIRLRENGWVDPDRPLVMLFLGSSGIGKTELAKQVAYYLDADGSDKNTACSQSLTEIEKSGAYVRIDMSEYQHSHTVSNLTGMLLST